MSMSSVFFLSSLCHLSFFVFESVCFSVTNCDNVVWWLCVLCCVVSVGLCWCMGCVLVCMSL